MSEKKHWMPEKKPQYVMGVPYQIVDIDKDKVIKENSKIREEDKRIEFGGSW